MSPALKNLVVALCITLVLSVAYIIFTRTSTDTVADGPVANPALFARSQKILSDTSKIDSYRMDTSILTDKRFTSFVNTRINLSDIPLDPGRDNPFAPVAE